MDRDLVRRCAGRTLVLALLLGAQACAVPGSTAKNPFDGARGMQQIQIEVLNLNWNDATLHALRGGERHRLGVVHGKGEALYRMDWPMSLPLRIEIDLLASGSCVTRELLVDPGDRVQLQIEPDLSMDPDCRQGR
jgi:hypothetical protein